MADQKESSNDTTAARRGKDFGSDDLRALVGGGGFLHQQQPSVGGSSSSNKKKSEWGDYTVAETAALLRQEQEKASQQKQQQQQKRGTRHRDETKQRTYQQLVQLPENDEKTVLANHQKDDFREEGQSFPIANSSRRKKSKPVVLHVGREKQHANDSTRTSSDEDDPIPPRHDSSSSSSDEDSVADRRRQRLLQRVRKDPEELLPTELSPREASTTISPPTLGPTSQVDPIPVRPKRPRQNSSSSSEESSSDDSSDDDDSEESEEQPVQKIVFIPKHKRNLQQSLQQQQKDEQERQKQQERDEERRIRASRAMVQQAVTAVKAQVDTNPTTTKDGVLGAMNQWPSDEITDDKTARQEWEVRELERLLRDWDLEQARIGEEKELARRRNMTDEEFMKEQQEKGNLKHERKSQRFYHKGAFYMDESEWKQGDVRHKAEEYAAAQTGDDKRDRSQLPKIMQNRRFGFANQSRWKGLAAEDTTDKSADMLSFTKRKKEAS